MSLIGTLEQLHLSTILQGIETYAKTGLLIIKQEGQWVELYFRDGRLMCIGPVKANTTLGDRLVQAEIISPSALQETLLAMGEVQCGETRIAITLMELSHVSHEELQAWATQEATIVLKIVLLWQKGDIYFEDGLQPPTDRLLVALSALSLLPQTPAIAGAPQPQQVQSGVDYQLIQQQPSQSQQPIHPTSATSQSFSQLIDEAPPRADVAIFASPILAGSAGSVANLFAGSDTPGTSTLTPPQPIMAPLPLMPVDTSYLQPTMVLMPVDVSTLREQNPQIALTPEHWRLLTRVDGHTSLQQACSELAMPVSTIRQAAGELIALGLVQAMTPQQAAVQDRLPISREPIAVGVGNGHITPAYAAVPAQPWAAVSPTTDAYTYTLPQASQAFPLSAPVETQSQWGNGGSGATFVPNRGWVAIAQPLQSSGPLYLNGAFAPVGSGR